MAPTLVATVLAEPAVPHPPRRTRADVALLVVGLGATLAEGLLRSVAWWPLSGLVIGALVAAVALLRRSHPLAVLLAVFGSIIGVDLVALALGEPPIEYYSGGIALVAVYAVFRWGSGRDAAIGAVAALGAMTTTLVTNWTNLGDAIGGALVLAAPGALGLEVRHLVRSRARDLHDAARREREDLARELHDSIAHHVSAIAVRAQAGGVVGRDDPAAALDALAVVEREARRALAEMRALVGSLRGAAPAELAPAPGLRDVTRLAAEPGLGPEIRLDVAGELLDGRIELAPAVATAVYRITQEAITNARRHGRHVTGVDVVITADDERVAVAVADDGEHDGRGRATTGFGLVGMAERASLLGGTFDAGPAPGGGWRVAAAFPRGGSA